MEKPASQITFVMHGARAAVADGMLHIEEQVKAIELAVVQNTGFAFDLAKTLIESACKTILRERHRLFDKDDDLPKLFKMVRQVVPLLPASLRDDPGARKRLEQTLNGLSNAFGFASHGSDSPRPAMEAIHATLAAQAADAIVGFLYSVHRQDLVKPRTPRLEYGDHADFNEWIDEQCAPVQILSLPPYRPSEVLFYVDQEAYRDLLADFGSAEVNSVASAEGEQAQ